MPVPGFLNAKSSKVILVPAPNARFETIDFWKIFLIDINIYKFQRCLVLIDFNQRRNSGEIQETLHENIKSGKATRALKRNTEAAEKFITSLTKFDLTEIGSLLERSWKEKIKANANSRGLPVICDFYDETSTRRNGWKYVKLKSPTDIKEFDNIKN